MTDYRLALAQRSASGLGAEVIPDVLAIGFPYSDNAKVFTWGKLINGAGSVTFTLPIDGAGVTEANFYAGRELHLYRDSGAGEDLVWAGHLWEYEVDAPFVRFMGLGWWEYFRHRQMRDDFFRTSYEQLDGVWELIDYAQGKTNGDIGVTRGSATASGTERDFEYCAEECEIIADAVEEYSGGDDGFDFSISPLKVWQTYVPKRGSDLSGTVVLNAGSNVTGLSYSSDGTQLENDVAGVGPADDCEPIHMQTATNVPSQVKHGLMESAIQVEKPGHDMNLLDAAARERKNLYGWPLRQPTVSISSELASASPLEGDFNIGDTIMLAATYGFATFTEPYRFLGFDCSVDALGRETLDLTLDAAV